MNKKKLLIGIAGALLLILILAVAVVAFKLDSIVKAGIETVGPRLTKTTVTLEKVNLRPLSGSGALHGFVIGTPVGFQAEYTMKMGLAHLDLQPGSLLGEKIVIDEILIEGPEIILEGGLKENNLTALQKNVNESVGATEGAPTSEPAADEPAGVQRKLQVNRFKLTGARVHLRLSMMQGRSLTITAPDIEFTDLGTGPDGITVGELTQRALNALTRDVLAAAAKSATELGREAAGAAGQAATEAVDGVSKEAVGKATEGLKNLFKKDE
jgi:hypothetical protein